MGMKPYEATYPANIDKATPPDKMEYTSVEFIDLLQEPKA